MATQFHAQDEFGNVAYGYANPNAAKEERRDSNGHVRGAYRYTPLAILFKVGGICGMALDPQRRKFKTLY